MAKKSKKKDKEKVVKKTKKDSEEVCETFEVTKEGKEEVKTVCGSIEKKHASAKEEKTYNTILRNFLIGAGVIIALVLLGVYFMNSVRYFEYRGLEGEVVQEGDLIFYKTAFTVIADGNLVPYNFYLRNNPEKLGKEVPFILEDEKDGIILGMKFSDKMHRLVLNMSTSAEGFMCEGSKEGDDIIAVANMINLKALGIKVVGDENATCDIEGDGRYMFANVIEGERTEIRQIGPACYELMFTDCDILKVTERFMVELFVKQKDEINRYQII